MDGIAVVTGASSGIGEAIAQRLLHSGCDVIVLQRRPPRLHHGRLQHYAVDLADAAAAQVAATEIAANHQVRYLVNNAGVNRSARLEQATVEDLDYAMALNVRAALILIKAFTPAMRAAKFGRIVNISSRAVLGKTYRTVYSAAKAALIGMTRTLCLELGGDGITINVLAPGPVATELFDHGHPPGSHKRQLVIDSIPVKRVGTPDDIARVGCVPARAGERLYHGADHFRVRRKQCEWFRRRVTDCRCKEKCHGLPQRFFVFRCTTVAIRVQV